MAGIFVFDDSVGDSNRMVNEYQDSLIKYYIAMSCEGIACKLCI